MKDLDSPDRATVFANAAETFRKRASVWQKLGKSAAADKDVKHAEELEMDAWKLTAGKSKSAGEVNIARLGAWKAPPPGRVLLTNQWTGPVTLRVDGKDYRLGAGEEKTLEREPGTVRYELLESGQGATGTVEPGRTFRVKVGG